MNPRPIIPGQGHLRQTFVCNIYYPLFPSGESCFRTLFNNLTRLTGKGIQPRTFPGFACISAYCPMMVMDLLSITINPNRLFFLLSFGLLIVSYHSNRTATKAGLGLWGMLWPLCLSFGILFVRFVPWTWSVFFGRTPWATWTGPLLTAFWRNHLDSLLLFSPVLCKRLRLKDLGSFTPKNLCPRIWPFQVPLGFCNKNAIPLGNSFHYKHRGWFYVRAWDLCLTRDPEGHNELYNNYLLEVERGGAGLRTRVGDIFFRWMCCLSSFAIISTLGKILIRCIPDGQPVSHQCGTCFSVSLGK